MKKFILMLLILPAVCKAQQNLQTNLTIDFMQRVASSNEQSIQYQGKDGVARIKLPVFTVFGIANLNQETLKTFNAGGKATVAIRPYIQHHSTSTRTTAKSIAFYSSFNKSASNNDSIVHSKLIFPELGSSSFIGTLQFEHFRVNKVGKVHNQTVFFEMSIKSVRSDSMLKGQRLSFDALNYTLGYKYGFCYSIDNPFEPGKKVNIGFYFSPFVSVFNIPDEDVEDYKRILTSNATVTGDPSKLKDLVLNAGVKTGFHFNGIEFFADMRHVSRSGIPIRELRGFHANIGFVFNADVLNFY